MSNWRAMLKEAKELFEEGLLDESEYKAEKLGLCKCAVNPRIPEPQRHLHDPHVKTP